MDMIQKLRERRAFLDNQKVRIVQMGAVVDGAIAENIEMLKILETPEARPPEAPLPENPKSEVKSGTDLDNDPLPPREETLKAKPKKGKKNAPDYAMGGE